LGQPGVLLQPTLARHGLAGLPQSRPARLEPAALLRAEPRLLRAEPRLLRAAFQPAGLEQARLAPQQVARRALELAARAAEAAPELAARAAEAAPAAAPEAGGLDLRGRHAQHQHRQPPKQKPHRGSSPPYVPGCPGEGPFGGQPPFVLCGALPFTPLFS